MRHAYATLCCLVVVPSCATAPRGHGETLEKLRELQRRVTPIVDADEDAQLAGEELPLTDGDLDLLEAAGISMSQLTLPHLHLVARFLRFGQSLRPEELPTVEEFGASAEGRNIATVLALALAERGYMDRAARLLVVGASQEPRDRRSYATWKMWEVTYGARDDYCAMTRELSLALLHRFEIGDSEERLVVTDLCGDRAFTEADLPAMRSAIERNTREREEAFARHVQSFPERIWIEDRRGRRQVPGAALARGRLLVIRHEIRLLQPGAGDASPAEWGTLVSFREARGENLAARHALLRRVATAAGDAGIDLESEHGVIAICLCADEVDWELHARVQAIDEAVGSALAGWAMAAAPRVQATPAGEAHPSRLATVAADVLAAVRKAAIRLRELTSSAARRAPPDEAGDEPVLASLRAARAGIDSLLADLAAAPPAAASCRDMPFQFHVTCLSDGKRHEVRGRTRVEFTPAEATVYAIQIEPGSGSIYGAGCVTLRPEELRDAEFSMRDDTRDEHQQRLGERCIVVTPKRPVPQQLADRSLRIASTECVVIQCDSDAHRQQLVDELKRFAGIGPR